jgi:UDP-N-acetyl-D-mannosaminuronate dehydrogenase
MAKVKSVSEITHIGIIGAGQMGNGIAHVAAQNGFKVTMVDVNPASLEKALATIAKNMERQIQKGAMSEADKKAAEKRLHTSTTLADLKDCDLIIEAATENEEVKKKIFKEIDTIAQKKCQPSGKIHRPALHEPGTDDGAGGNYPRPRNLAGNLRTRAGSRPQDG